VFAEHSIKSGLNSPVAREGRFVGEEGILSRQRVSPVSANLSGSMIGLEAALIILSKQGGTAEESFVPEMKDFYF